MAMAIYTALVAALIAVVILPVARADFHLECQMIPASECAFAVSYSGHRCVLEKQLGTNVHECKTSDIMVGEGAPIEYIETNACVSACGVERMTVGFSTDELSSGEFISKICSAECKNRCVNLVDLYSNIIAGEGLTISEFCGEQRRAMLMQSRRLISSAYSPTAL